MAQARASARPAEDACDPFDDRGRGVDRPHRFRVRLQPTINTRIASTLPSRDFGRPTDVRCRPAASLDRQDDTAPPQPGGNRQANNALYRIVITRTSSDERTRTYVARRRAEGKSTGEIVRILKRYVAREVFRHLQPASA